MLDRPFKAFFFFFEHLNARLRFRQRGFVLRQLVLSGGLLRDQLLQGFMRSFQAGDVQLRLPQVSVHLRYFVRGPPVRAFC